MKCSCGYEVRLPGEEEMLAQWGCARAVAIQGTLGTGQRVTMCSHDNVPPDTTIEDTAAFDEAFKQKYVKNTPKKPGDGKK